VEILGRRRSAPPQTVWRRSDLWRAATSVTGFVALGLVCRGRPARTERRVFHATNHHTSGRPVLRVPQQLGTPWVLPSLALLGLLTHRPHLAVTAAAALPLEKGLEVGAKKLLARRRPSQVDPHVELHDDAPEEGPSYPSGHAAIAFSAVLLAGPYLPRSAEVLGLSVAGVTSWVRVRQGAHFPLDAVGGGLLGLAVVSSLRGVIGRPA
jgi:membrane-associated phospholipid phosphatase